MIGRAVTIVITGNWNIAGLAERLLNDCARAAEGYVPGSIRGPEERVIGFPVAIVVSYYRNIAFDAECLRDRDAGAAGDDVPDYLRRPEERVIGLSVAIVVDPEASSCSVRRKDGGASADHKKEKRSKSSTGATRLRE